MSDFVDRERKIIYRNLTASSIPESEMLLKAVCFYDVPAFDDLKRLDLLKFVGHENGFSVFEFNEHRHKYLVNKNHEN